jgi:hypothetical protein
MKLSRLLTISYVAKIYVYHFLSILTDYFIMLADFFYELLFFLHAFEALDVFNIINYRATSGNFSMSTRPYP